MSTIIQWRDMQHSAAQLDAAADAINSHTANTTIHMTAAEKEKLESLENYDDTEIQAAIAAESDARQSADAALQTAIGQKQDILTIDQLPTSGSDNPVRSGGVVNWVYGTTPNTINNGDDLNDYYTPGTYRAASGSIAATLYNCPTASGFRLEVCSTIASASSGYQIQRLYPNNSDGEFFMRRRLGAASGNWGDWYRFAGTVVQPINVPDQAQLSSSIAPDKYDVEAAETGDEYA